jgi:hypothetical protein
MGANWILWRTKMWSRITAARVYGRERDRERASAFSTELTPRPSRGIIETSGRKKEATHTLGGVCVCVYGVVVATFSGF